MAQRIIPISTPTPTGSTPPTVTIGEMAAPVDPLSVGATVNISANFTDSDPSQTHTVTIDWGDGTTSPGTVSETNGTGTVSGSHT
ncbi:hypothetical protein ACFLXQ_07740 [Chloroflexota bacterium]